MAVTVDEVCDFARTLPGINEGVVRGNLKFRVKRIVWLSLSPDGSTMGFAFPKYLREALVHSDPEAMAVIDLALNRGVSVPGGLSIASYDDEIAQLFSPALTAVCPPRAAIGEAALDLLADRIADPARPTRRVILSPCLNVRDSTAPPGTAG